MAFIRIKKIKSKEYAYLVENKLNKRNNQTFDKGLITQKPPKDIIKNLVSIELKNIEFTQTKNTFKSRDIIVNLDALTVLNLKQKLASIELNQGFLNNYTLEGIVNYKQIQGTTKEASKHLANALISAGLDIDSSTFILIFNKFYPNIFKEINQNPSNSISA